MFNNRNVMGKSEIWAELEKRKVAKVQVDYSGGNDEGGVNDITLFDKDGKVMGRLEEEYIAEEYNPKTNKWERTKEPSADSKLAEGLGAPVYAKYYTFAGEFYVNGQVIYDVANRKIDMSGQREVTHYEDDN